MPGAPEQQARVKIDALLNTLGWVIQDMADFNRNAAECVAVRKFQLENDPCDYLLFVGGKAADVIEAKKAGIALSGVAEQTVRYKLAVPGHFGALVMFEVAYEESQIRLKTERERSGSHCHRD
jgi:type I restriction enzyme R subunit